MVNTTVCLACLIRLKSGTNLLNKTLTSESDYLVQDLENRDWKLSKYPRIPNKGLVFVDSR